MIFDTVDLLVQSATCCHGKAVTNNGTILDAPESDQGWIILSSVLILYIIRQRSLVSVCLLVSVGRLSVVSIFLGTSCLYISAE